MSETVSLELGRIVWRLDAYAGHWLTATDLTAVTEWMADNHLERATAQRPVIVECGRITYGQDRSDLTVRAQHRDIATVTVPLLTAPPAIVPPLCEPAHLAVLHAVLAQHEWSSGFGGVCVDCSRTQTAANGQIWCHRDDVEPWPCPPVRTALREAKIPVPGPAEAPLPRVLGDCLSPAHNARAFGTS
ncbi:hypothetical protein [Kribbella sp. NPDC048928]|uniref:hypothetical protein n=1 Tax=Kribbella sp. NPDC048928 TaxID=3364111 RepID=UPI003711CA0D